MSKQSTGSCMAIGKDGNPNTITRFADVVHVHDSENGPGERTGNIEFRDSQGGRLNALPNGTFKNVTTGEILAPDGPFT
jgi:hypothetical protein